MTNMNVVRTEQILSNLMKLAEIISASYAKRKYESPALQCYIQGRIDGISEICQYLRTLQVRGGISDRERINSVSGVCRKRD